MGVLFVALGVMLVLLLFLLIWFVPHLLQQQSLRVASETSQLRELLVDLISEQESVTARQMQLGSALAQLQSQIETMVQTIGVEASSGQPADHTTIHQLETRIADLQGQLQSWLGERHQRAPDHILQDNEAWAYLLSLLAAIQERVGALSHDRAHALAGVHAGALLEELEQEMQNLRSISEEIAMLQWRLRRSLHEREVNLSVLRSHEQRSLTG